MGRVTRPPSPDPPAPPAFLAAILFVVAGASMASAEDVLGSRVPVTDSAGVLDGDVAEVEAAIDRTLDEHNVQVFVLFVNTTGDVPMADYAEQTAATNSLGVDDALLPVAMDDRTDYIWVSDGLDITDDELDTILTEELEPRLRDGDEAAAGRSRRSMGSALLPNPLPRPRGRSSPVR